jgi:DNA modification methylase
MKIEVKQMTYLDFLKSKIKTAPESGFSVAADEINPVLKPHERDSVMWMVRGGRRALFSCFGLGKTVTQLEALHLILAHEEGGYALITAPLAVVHVFQSDAEKLLGIDEIPYVRTMSEVHETIRRLKNAGSSGNIFITNYERVRDGDIDPAFFTAASLDEAAVLRSYGSKTYQEFLIKFQSVKYRFVATATPSPNRYKEIIHYAGFLGIMDTGAALTQFFHRDSSKANNLTLYPHKEKEFWFWVSTWALFITKPSDLGYSDEGYILPPMKIIYHMVDADHKGAGKEDDGQVKMFRDAALGLRDAAKEKRDSLPSRIGQIKKLLYCCINEYINLENNNDRETEEMESVVREKSGKPVGETEDTGENILSGTQGGNKETKQDMAGEQSRKNERTTAETYRKKQGKNQKEICGLVQGEQIKSEICRERSKNEAGIWNINRNIRPDDRRPAMEMCNMREGYIRQGSAACRPRSQDGESAGNSLRELQHGNRAVTRFSRNISSGLCLSGRQIIIWCDLNDEQKAIEGVLEEIDITYVSIYGYQNVYEKNDLIKKWLNKEAVILLTKPEMYGSGANLQQSHIMIYAGINYSFSDFIQSTHRIHRFGQDKPCEIHIIYAESEQAILDALKKKWEQHNRLVAQMAGIIREYGLFSTSIEEKLARSIGVSREEIKGERFTAAFNDNVLEMPRIADNSVDLIHTSVPFSNHYEYSLSYNDYGHNEDNSRFFEQMDYLTPELLRVLKPGRVAAVHVKDRILFGNATGTGMPTVEPFSDMTMAHYMKHGFQYMGRITVVTDVVRENNQTYRLGWTEQCKDGTKMGVGCPEYILLFRKLPSDTSKAYADSPVTKSKEDYTRARWQIDAHAFWRSSGNRLAMLEELRETPVSDLQAKYREYSRNNIYDHTEHVDLAEELEEDGHLPASFMVVAPGSHSEWVWDDVVRMRTLNSEQVRKELQTHICLATGTLILTKNGYKPIEDIEINDLVLTHKGRWKPVTAKACTGENEIIELKAQGVPGLKITPDHKIWTRKTDWKRARDGAERITPDWIEAKNTLGGYVNQKLPPIENCMLSEQACWIIGRWIADGSLNHRGELSIACGKNKIDTLLEKMSNYAGKAYEARTAYIVPIRRCSELFRAAIRQCGHGAENKKLPPWAVSIEMEKAKAMLDGYLSGDGHLVKYRDTYSATSISYNLILGLSFLVQRAYGAVASIHKGKPERDCIIEGRKVHAKQEYVISFSIPKETRRNKPFILEDGAWKLVRSVAGAGRAVTWSIKVAEDESYTAEGCIVKNCPLQIDIVERIIRRYSNPGELVLDPFGGLMTVPYVAVKMGRKGYGIELNHVSFVDGCRYLKEAEMEISAPTLFDLESIS